MPAVVLVLVLGQLAGASKASCPAIEDDLVEALTRSEGMMEPEGARAHILARAQQALKQCPESETIAYVGVRAGELGTRIRPLDAPPDAQIVTIARAFATQFPKSARISTVKARLEGTVEASRRALSIDPAYGPARVALAAALLNAREVATARTTIDGVKDLRAVDDGYAVLARIKWAQGDSAGAAAAAQAEINGRLNDHQEPGGGSSRARAEAHAILGLAYLKKNNPDKAVPHLLEAETISPQVRELIAHPDPSLRKALARQKRAPVHRPVPAE